MQAILYVLAALNGFLLGGLVCAYFIFEHALLPTRHPLIKPILVIGATLGGLTAWFIDADYLIAVVIIEGVVNIALATYTTREAKAAYNN